MHTVNKTVGDEVTCSGVHVVRNCSYTWQRQSSHGNVTVLTSSAGDQKSLKFEQPGIYICEFVCFIHGAPCATSTMLVNVYEREGSQIFLIS